jgi:hypothetical protein
VKPLVATRCSVDGRQSLMSMKHFPSKIDWEKRKYYEKNLSQY